MSYLYCSLYCGINAVGHRELQSELEDWTPLRARRTESIGEGRQFFL